MADSSVVDDVEVQQQLDEKDQLIRALTDRLEEAAEQLDRVSRSGGKPGPSGGRSSGGSGVSAELLAGQQTIIEQLEKSAELWEDVQPRDVFMRMEEQLDGLRRILETSSVSRPAAAVAPRDAAAPQAAPAPREAATPADAPATKVDPLSGWEKMKAELMGETPAVPQGGEQSVPCRGSCESAAGCGRGFAGFGGTRLRGADELAGGSPASQAGRLWHGGAARPGSGD